MIYYCRYCCKYWVDASTRFGWRYIDIPTIPLKACPNCLKKPKNEDFKCPICGSKNWTSYNSGPRQCSKCWIKKMEKKNKKLDE